MARRRKPADSPPDTGSIRAAALTLLSRRDYTAAELESKLLDKGYDRETAAAAVASLAASRAIDDRRVAAAHVRTAAAVKGRGRVRIARELTARGVSRDVVNEALGEVAREDELASIRKILTGKRWPSNPSRLDRQRMYRHLLARGFPSDLISRALGRGAEDDSM